MSEPLSESLKFSPGLAAMLANQGTDEVIAPAPKAQPARSRNIPASAPTARKERRALVKALGARQFKKIYRGIKV